jgi:hypothetical protein
LVEVNAQNLKCIQAREVIITSDATLALYFNKPHSPTGSNAGLKAILLELLKSAANLCPKKVLCGSFPTTHDSSSSGSLEVS